MSGRGKAGRSGSRVSAEEGPGRAPGVGSSRRPRHRDQALTAGATASRRGLARTGTRVGRSQPRLRFCPGHHRFAYPRRGGRSRHPDGSLQRIAVILYFCNKTTIIKVEGGCVFISAKLCSHKPIVVVYAFNLRRNRKGIKASLDYLATFRPVRAIS